MRLWLLLWSELDTPCVVVVVVVVRPKNPCVVVVVVAVRPKHPCVVVVVVRPKMPMCGCG